MFTYIQQIIVLFSIRITCKCVKKQTTPWMATVFLRALFTKHLLMQITNKCYYCSCKNTFKERYNNHKCSFRNKPCEKNTELPKYIWELKEKDINYFINWFCGSQKCDLYIERSSLLQGKIVMFCSINVMSLFQNVVIFKMFTCKKRVIANASSSPPVSLMSNSCIKTLNQINKQTNLNHITSSINQIVIR